MRDVERRIAELRTAKRQQEQHFRRCESTMSADAKKKAIADINKMRNALTAAQRDRQILIEYERANTAPVFASKEEGYLISPSLVKLVSGRERA